MTLNVTGADTFADTQTIPSLAGCGGQATVTFAAFTPGVLGNDIVQVSVPADDVAANNSLSKALSITPLSYSYKYPGSTASGGTGWNGATAAMVSKFQISGVNAITDVKLEFFATQRHDLPGGDLRGFRLWNAVDDGALCGCHGQIRERSGTDHHYPFQSRDRWPRELLRWDPTDQYDQRCSQFRHRGSRPQQRVFPGVPQSSGGVA